MRKPMLFTVPTVLLVLLLLPVQGTVSGDHDHGGRLVSIEPRQIGDNPYALIWTWGKFQGNTPLSIGVTFTDAALDDMFTAAFDGFPREIPHKTAPHLESARVYDLPFPDKVRKRTPFDHMGWFANLEGHNPPFVFDVAHIDVHFFMITPEERAAIKGGLDPESPDDFDPKLLIYPPPGFLPVDFCLPLIVPLGQCKTLLELTEADVPGSNDAEQGLHWVDRFAPELRGKAFEQIFIYGSYDGEVNFWEPMITKAFFEKVRSFLKDLESTEKTIELSLAIKQPEQFPETSFYPTQYSIRYDAEVGEFSVSLDNFVLRKAAKGDKQ